MLIRRRDQLPKYASRRNATDVLYSSRRLKIFNGAFIKKGRSKTAARLLFNSICSFRQQTQLGHSVGHFFIATLERNWLPINLVKVRKFSQFLPVPMPVTRLRARLRTTKLFVSLLKASAAEGTIDRFATGLVAEIQELSSPLYVATEEDYEEAADARDELELRYR